MNRRLGLNIPRDAWPAAQLLTAYEAAGFGWVQVHTPPSPVLAESALALAHARALRSELSATGLRLLLHAPDDLSAGTPEGDRAFMGMLEYAAQAGAELVAYHGLNFADAADDPAAARVRERALLEELSLTGLLQRAHALGVTVAIENLAPMYAPPVHPARRCHDPLAVRNLVRRLGSPAAGMLLDLGHLHITSDARRGDHAAIVAACAADVVLFHVHDNLGARRNGLGAPGADPLKLDLHLPPGRGSLPWDRLAPALAEHPAPLMLEIEPSQRQSRDALAAAAARLLAGRPERAAA
jgi:sugar phosphate isomerase/epimerase